MIASDLPLPESDRSSGHSRCQVRTPHGRVTCPNALIGRSSIRPPAAAPDLRIAMRDIQVSCLGHLLARECRSPMSTRHRSNQSNTSADNPILFGLRRGWTANDRHLRARVKAGNVSSVVRSDPGPTKLLIRSRPQPHQLRPMRLASLSEQLRDWVPTAFGERVLFAGAARSYRSPSGTRKYRAPQGRLPRTSFRQIGLTRLCQLHSIGRLGWKSHA